MSLSAAPKLTRKRNLGFALETSTNVPATIDATACVTNVFGTPPMIKYSTEKVAREPQGGLSPILQARGARSGTATFDVELVGNGSAGTPAWFALFQACGWQLSGGALSPLDSANQTITLAEFIDGRQRILSGCMGNFTIKLRRGQPGRVSFTFTGVQQPPVDAALPAPAYVAVKAPRVGASTFTIGGAQYRVPEIEIDSGNKVVLRESIDADALDSAGNPTGYAGCYIAERNVTVKASPEALDIATKSWWADFQTEATSALALTIGAASNNTFAFAAPVMQLEDDPEDTDRDGAAAEGLKWSCTRNSSAGMDEMTITAS